MRYTFDKISKEELADFLRNSADRYFYMQSADYIKVCDAMNRAYDVVALKNDQETLATGIIFKYRFKKVFRKAELVFGPITKDGNTHYFLEFMKRLLDFYKKNIRVISLRVVPFVLDRYFDDVEIVGKNPDAETIKQALESLGFKHLTQDFTDNPTLQVKYIYVKNIENTELEELKQSFNYQLRRKMKKANELDIKVKFLKPDELGIIEQIFAETSERVHYKVNMSNTKYIAENYKEAYFPVAYMSAIESIKNLRVSIEELDAEIEKINRKNEDLGENKKRRNKLDKVNQLRESQIKRLNRIKSLSDKYGDVMNMSCGTFYCTKSDMIYLQGGMRKDFEEFYPNQALLETMLKLAIDKGCKYFNLFGISAKSLVDENASDYGVLQFKRNFSGEVQEFIGTYDYSYLPF